MPEVMPRVKRQVTRRVIPGVMRQARPIRWTRTHPSTNARPNQQRVPAG
jgi:hypothetical protein